MDLKSNILALLRAGETYVSGQELCKQFGVSRTAVWKAVHLLEEEGYVIEAVKNKGYRLISYPDSIAKSEIASRIHTRWLGKDIFYFQETDSTNEDAKRLSARGADNGTLIIADCQKSGKGRRGRVWQMTPGTSIAFSVLLRPSIPPNRASMITLLMAMAVARAVKEVTGLDAGIKWPNDVVINGKKICGILTEMTLEADYIHDVIIGTGINVNQEAIPPELQDKATSLFLEKGAKINRADILERTICSFEFLYDLFLQKEDLTDLVEEYNAALVSRNKEVRVMDPKGEFSGISRGINQKGELLVEEEKGIIRQVYSGEVSVRGIYGYV